LKQHISPPLSLPENSSEIILKRISFILILIAALFLSIRQIYGEDIGFHLQAGRWMIENLSFPDKDTFTYTANENKYIDLYWLYQLLMYGTYLVGGSVGLILVNALFVVSSVLILFKRTSGNSSAFLSWIFLFAVLAVSPSLEIRPHSLSWLFLGLVLYILQQFYDGNKKIIRWLSVIMILWVNCHSLFILGIVVMGCYGISVFVKRKELFKEYFIWSLIAVAACLINPYGWNGFSLPFQQMLVFGHGSIFKENIREFQGPFSITEYAFTIGNLLSKWHFFDLFILITMIGVILQFKRLRIHEWLIIIIFFYFAYSLTKNIGYFVFAITPIIANGFIAERNKKSAKKNIPFSMKYVRPVTVLFMISCILLILVVRTNAFYIHYRASYRFGFDWKNSSLPVKASEFLAKNNLHGKMLNQLDLGGYLEFFANQKTSIDGRLEVIGEKIFSEQVLAKSDERKNALVQKLDPDMILFSYFITPDWITFLQRQPDWRLVYADESTAMYFKNTYASSFQAINEKAFTYDIPQYSDIRIDQILKNKKSVSFLSSLFHSQYYPENELNETVFCFYYGWIEAAKQITANGLDKSSSDYPELYQNLGTIYFQYKDKDRSLYCYEKYLETIKSPQVAERVRFLKSL
jgi:hypothetical protein